MKKTFLFTIVMVLGLLLSACGASSTGAEVDSAVIRAENVESTGQVPPEGTLEPGAFKFEIPMQTLLIIGTFELEETALAVQADQAVELLPLWQVLKSLLESDTAAAAEVDALVNQIAETMTDEQMQAIEAMDLNNESLFALNSALGLDQAFQRPEGVEEGSGGFQRPEGMPEGFGPGGGQGIDSGLSPEELDSLRATRQASGGGGFGMRGGGLMNVPLIEALIDLLQSK